MVSDFTCRRLLRGRRDGRGGLRGRRQKSRAAGTGRALALAVRGWQHGFFGFDHEDLPGHHGVLAPGGGR